MATAAAGVVAAVAVAPEEDILNDAAHERKYVRLLLKHTGKTTLLLEHNTAANAFHGGNGQLVPCSPLRTMALLNIVWNHVIHVI